jgi:gas vesicle protein
MTKQTRNRQQEEQGNGSGFVTVLLLGGLAGAGAMLLLAPQSGKKTRAQLQKQGMKLGKQTVAAVEEGVAQMQAKAHELSDTVYHQAEELQERGQEAVKEGKERMNTAIKTGKSAVQEALN